MADRRSFEVFHLNEDFVIFNERIETWFKKMKITSDDDKVVELLNSLSKDVYTLVRNAFTPVKPDTLKYDDLVKYLQKQFVKFAVPFKERRSFYECNQCDGESVLDYYNKLMALAAACEFQNGSLKGILRDKFICGLTRGPIFERMCEQELTVSIDDCVKLAQAKEVSLPGAADCHKIHRQYGSIGKSPAACTACGQTNHNFARCRYREYTCDLCKKMGHLAKVCTSGGQAKQGYKGHRGMRKQKRTTHNQHFMEENNPTRSIITEESCGEDNRLFNIDAEEQPAVKISATKAKMNRSNYQEGYFYLSNFNSSDSFDCRLFVVTLDVDGVAIDFEIDTGSAISALPFDIYRQKFGNVVLQSYAPVLKAYNGSVIEVAGSINLNINHKGMSFNSMFVVIKKGCRPLIGRDIFRRLRFEIDMNTISSNSIRDKMRSEFGALFSKKLGMYNVSKVSLRLKSDINPVFVKPRTVPFAYKEKLEVELERLERDGVISKVETCDYGSPLVCVMKKDGRMRVCADYSVTVNSFVEDFNYPLPKIDELLRALQGGKRFSKIDLSQAYLQLPVDEETGKVLAWSTHKGLFVVNR